MLVTSFLPRPLNFSQFDYLGSFFPGTGMFMEEGFDGDIPQLRYG
jgi:hypothetical protein